MISCPAAAAIKKHHPFLPTVPRGGTVGQQMDFFSSFSSTPPTLGVGWDCTVLYCTVLYCTVLYCTVLYCTVPYCTVPYNHPHPPKKNQNVQNKGGLNCTVDRGSCAADVLLFLKMSTNDFFFLFLAESWHTEHCKEIP